MSAATSKHLPDDDYVLSEGAAWFTVNGFAVRIWSPNGAIQIDVLDDQRMIDGEALVEPLASAHAYEHDLLINKQE